MNEIHKTAASFICLLACVVGIGLFPAFVGAPIASVLSPQTAFQQVEVEARAAVVLDVETGEILFSKNEDEVLPLASLTKIVTALVAKEVLPSNGPLVVSGESIKEEGDSGFRVGDVWGVNNLAAITLVASLNDGAVVLAENTGKVLTGSDNFSAARNAFLSSMNERVLSAGFDSISFNNESGLDESQGVSGAYGNARDVAGIFAEAIQGNPALFRDTRFSSSFQRTLGGEGYLFKNTNSQIASLHGALGSKTGFTDLAGGNLAVAFDVGLNHPVVAVVLGSTAEDRFDDIERLIRATRDFFNTRRSSVQGYNVPKVPNNQ